MKLISFEIPDLENIDQRIKQIEELTESALDDLRNFNFDRVEAINYEE